MTTPRDFDFLHGAWRVRNRRLRDPLTGSAEWYEFEGTATERPVWDGQGNLEEYDAVLPDGTRLRGLALRLYEPERRRWTIHWSSAATGTLDAPMTGAFQGGVGEFHGRDEHRGRPVDVRFRWTSAGPDEARWEQAFSADGGATWETNWIMDFTRAHAVVELRHYVLKPGARERLVDVFDRELVDGQEAVGLRVLAQFRDVDRPDVFTWLRGFPDMASRPAPLAAFYDGPVWAAHRDAANGTMVSSDDVRLLRPLRPGTALALDGASSGLVVATIYTLHDSAAAGFAERFERTAAPVLAGHGARPIAIYETEPAPNNFPRHPVREGERAFVWFARYAGVAEQERADSALERDPAWTRDVRPALERAFRAPALVWRLTPTARSRMPR